MTFDKAGQLYIAYASSKDKFNVRVKAFLHGKWVSVGNPRSHAAIDSLNLAISNGVVYLVFTDAHTHNIRVLSYGSGGQQGRWADVGSVRAHAAETVSLAFSHGEPFLGFVDYVSFAVRVLHYSGNVWKDLGATGRHAVTLTMWI